MTERRVFLFNVEGRQALGFDTGLDSRSFAQAKLAGLITEPGLIVRLNTDGQKTEFWNASGVAETDNDAGTGRPLMAVWGPPFEGERLDLILNDNVAGRQDRALAAVTAWIQAIAALGNPPAAVPLWPCAALIDDSNTDGNTAVFFSPAGLAKRCLMTGETAFSGGEWYVNGDLDGADATAFTAAAMLYRIFAGMPAFSGTDEIVIHQDMREGNFLPVRLAAPGLDSRLAALIQRALTPPNVAAKSAAGQVKNNTAPVAAPKPDEFLAVLQRGTSVLSDRCAGLQPARQTVPAASLFQPLDDAGRKLLEKEKDQYLKIQTATVKTKRFVARNTAIIFGCLAAVIAVALIAWSTVKSRADLPTTAGMSPEQVIESYYNAFGELDHQLMEACVTGKAGKGDITMVINLFVINRAKQAYDINSPPLVISAEEWLENGGGDVVSNVFGVTDLHKEQVTDNSEQRRENREQKRENEGTEGVRYSVDYTLWMPDQTDGDEMPEQAAGRGTFIYMPPTAYYCRDYVTLINKKGNWRISEIVREER
jgi:hypothetical protein